MSVSAAGSNSNNPFAYLQSLWQQGSSAGATQTQSDPLSSLLATLDQQGSSPSGAASSATSSITTGGSTEPQFGAQTLQALLALQANGSNPQSLASQFDNAASGSDPLSAMQSGQSEGQQRHHHHHMGANGPAGSTTTDASSGSAASDTSSSTAGGGNGTGNNFIGQLLQMQAQLVAPVSAQSITTA